MSGATYTRSRDERLIAGVCGGLAAHLGVPVLWVRIAMATLVLLGGAGVLLYLWLWIFAPWSDAASAAEPRPMRSVLTRPAETRASADEAGPQPGVARETVRETASASAGVGAEGVGAEGVGAEGVGAAGLGAAGARATGAAAAAAGPADPVGPAPFGHPAAPVSRRRWPIAELLLGVCLLIAGGGLAVAQLGWELPLDVLLPGLVVLVGLGLAWWQIADRDRPERSQVPRVLGALALVAVGTLMFFVTAREPSVITVVAAAFAVLAGVALALAPWALRLNRELVAERAGRAREAERAEIAAHLHDSVLQTLAMIQQRSEPGSEVARLARGQERELREWLFRGADGGVPDVREAIDVVLREHAATLEQEFAVRFEIVAVGVGLGGAAAVPEAIVAAAREAMLNAARHAGGDVAVYIEISPQRVSVDVADRGPGLDLEALPDGRMGVRESILGRMERAGGTATISAGPGGSGTSVRLAMPTRPAGPPQAQPTQIPETGGGRE